MAKTASHRDRRAFWEQIIEGWQHSGLTVRAYCRREGLSEPSFYQWRRRLTGSQPNLPVLPGDRFAPVRVREDRESPNSHETDRSIEIAFPRGQIVRVPHDVDPKTLATVISVMEAV